MGVVEAIKDAEACNWSTGVALGLADQLGVVVVENLCLLSDYGSPHMLKLLASEVQDLIPVLESALKELQRRE